MNSTSTSALPPPLRATGGVRLASLVPILLLVGAAHRTQGPADVRSALAARVGAADQAGATGIAGKDGWLFCVPELRYLAAGPFWGADAAKVSKASNPAWMDPAPAILDFKHQLDALKIDLLVVPVPAKAAIYPDMLVDGAKTDVANRTDTAEGEFLKYLKGQGVKTLDLTPPFLQYRADHPDARLYSKEDTHWSATGIDVAAGLISSEIEKEGWFGAARKSKFELTPMKVVATGDIVAMLASSAPKPEPETFDLTRVTKDGGQVKGDGKSPLLLLGDSHLLVYSRNDVDAGLIASGAGFPENLSAKLGFIPDVQAVMGSGATPARMNLINFPHSLDGKKMIVWIFTARDFTESLQGWRKLPVRRPGG